MVTAIPGLAEVNRLRSHGIGRKTVLEKFGLSVQMYCPVNDPTPLVRDLVRGIPLTGVGVLMQESGLVDFSADVQSGYISEAVQDVGALIAESGFRTEFTAYDVPVGRWTGFKFRSNQSTSQTVYLAGENIDQPDVAAQAIYSLPTTVADLGGGLYEHAALFPSEVVERVGGFWVYLPVGTALSSADAQKGFRWNSGAMTWDVDDRLITLIQGVPSSYSISNIGRFTMGVVVDVDDVAVPSAPGVGAAMSLANDAEALAELQIGTDKRVTARVQTGGVPSYSLTSDEPVHPGANVLMLSYQRNAEFILWLNGKKAKAVGVGNDLMSSPGVNISLGASVETDFDILRPLSDARISDAFIVHGRVPTEADAFEIYQDYITSMSMTQVRR